MYISFPDPTKLRTVEAILRDHNVIPSGDHLPVIGTTHFINLRDDDVAKNVLHRLKEAGINPVLTSTV